MSDVPDGWARTTLADVTSVQLGRQRSPKNHVGPNMRPYLRAANVTWNGLSLDDVMQMNFSESEVETFRLLPDDILLSEASGSPSEVGKPAIWQGQIEDCCFQNTLLRVRSEHVRQRYLLWFFKWLALSGQFARGSRGVGIHHLGAKALSEWSVPIPPTHEQDRIVAAIEEQFSRLDAGAAALDRARQNLKAMRTSAFNVVVNNNAPLVALETLGEGPGAIVDGPFGSNLKTEHYTAAGPRVIRLQNIGDGEFVDAQAHIASEHFDRLKRHAVQPGDLVCAILGDVLPRVVIVPNGLGPAIVKADCPRIRLSPEVNVTFVWGVLNAPHTRHYVATKIKGVGRPRFTVRELRQVPIGLPSRDAQDERALLLMTQLAVIARLEKQLILARGHVDALRSSILAAAFTGKLVRQDPADEPASVLLDRIAEEKASSNGQRGTRVRTPRAPRQKVIG